jgi:hypothetical protein
MNKKIIIGLVIFIVILGVASFLYYRKSASSTWNEGDVLPQNYNGIIDFYRYDCPHCKNVENYVLKNNVKEKVQFVSLEIHKQDNANLLLEKAATCGIPQDELGVPFLWNPSGLSTSTKCIIGDELIISFFKAKIGQ